MRYIYIDGACRCTCLLERKTSCKRSVTQRMTEYIHSIGCESVTRKSWACEERRENKREERQELRSQGSFERKRRLHIRVWYAFLKSWYQRTFRTNHVLWFSGCILSFYMLFCSVGFPWNQGFPCTSYLVFISVCV